MPNDSIYTTHLSVVPPREVVRSHIVRSKELTKQLIDELEAASIASIKTEQSRKLSALARACLSLTFALENLSRRTQ